LVFVESEIGFTMNARAFIKYELEFNLSNPYVSIEEGSIDMLDERDDATNNESIEEVDNVQIK
jgi:hypothetical protein